MPVEVLESHSAWRMQERLSFFSSSVVVFAGKCLDGRGKTVARVRKEKANLESKQEKNNLDSLLADLWIHFEVVNSVVRREEGKECRNNGVKKSV